jgi:hypothetical protein
MNVHRLTLRALYVMCALVGVLALGGTPAQALVSHNFLFQFNEVPANSDVALPGPVTSLNSMTVDAGHLWIAEDIEGTNNFSRVDEFNAATGGFIAQPLHSETDQFLAVAVGHGSGEPEADLYVAEFSENQAAIGVYSEAGSKRATWSGAQTSAGPFPSGTISVIQGLAADNSGSLSDSAAGDVYVPVPGQKVIDVFKPEAGGAEKYVTQLTGTCATPSACATEQFTKLEKVAVSGVNGDVYVSDGNVVDVFEPTVLNEYAFVRQLTGTPNGPFKIVRGLTVDGSGDVYVIDNRETENSSGESPFVDQFSPSGVYLGQIAGTSGGPFPANASLNSVAADSTGDVYVGNRYREGEGGVTEVTVGFVDVFGPSVVEPDVTTEPPSEMTPESATLNGTVNPAKAGAATCWFVYGTSPSFGQQAPCTKEVPEGESPVAVQASVQLQPDTTYFYRLQASDEHGTNRGEPGQDREFRTPGAGVHDEFVTDVVATSARLGASIDPNGAPTTYYFQYSTSDTAACGLSSCATAPAPPGASVGSGYGDSAASQYVTGLSPSTTYHYRVVALSELAGKSVAVYGPDQALTTQAVGSAGVTLADGRQWELVSPPNKHGARIYPIATGAGVYGLTQAAEDGGGLAYLADIPTEAEPPANGYGDGIQVLSVRGGEGWSTRDIATPHNALTQIDAHTEYPFFTGDLSSAAAVPNGLDETLLSPEASEPTPYVRTEALCEEPDTATECYRPVLTGKEGFADVPPGTKFGTNTSRGGGTAVPVTFDGASPDLRYVLLRSEGVALTAGPIAETGIYEWSEEAPTSEALRMVSLLPSGEGGGPAPRRVYIGTSNPNMEGGNHAISDDGSRIFWGSSAIENGERAKQTGLQYLYMRDTVKEETVRIDAPRPGLPVSGQPEAIFKDASADGSKVVFTDGQRLTGDSGAEPTHLDLYECDIIEEAGKLACRLTDLTPAVSGRSANVQNVFGTSTDASYVYFIANGVLSANKNSLGEEAALGTCANDDETPAEFSHEACGLYVYHDGAITFIANVTNAFRFAPFKVDRGSGTYTSPNGRFMAFATASRLAGYDNRDAVSGKLDSEVYVYDAQAGHLACISCNPTGARPTGPGDLPAAPEPGLSYGSYRPHPVSDNGRVFFNSFDGLLSNDVNGSEDVYEFEPEGAGSCTSGVAFSTKNGGCLSLISSGTSPEPSSFLDASVSGNDVFFLTEAKLTSEDVDDLGDVYDARVCTTSVPCVTRPVPAPPCSSGDACKGAPSLQPSIFGEPASATFTGAGNVAVASSGRGVKGRSLTRAEKLARALRACRKRPKRLRSACVRQAKKRYGAAGARRAVKSTTKGQG